MSQIYLHHYAFSPFSEKIRLALGIKGLSWNSVEIPPAPPRPLLVPMTGGYRRTPVLQIGADVYCDTNIILPALERHQPAPTLYPGGYAGMSQALSFNWERTIWIPVIGVLVHFLGDLPPEFIKDRKEGYLYLDISRKAMEPAFELNVQRVRSQLAWLTTMLADGRKFIFGNEPGALDLGYFHPISLIRKNCPPAEVDSLLSLGQIVPWYERVASLGHGKPVEASAETALAAAKAAKPIAVKHIDGADGLGLKPGDAVTVTPDDFAKVPVAGKLVAADANEVVIHRSEVEAGDVHIHFPRAGFEVKAA
jgi:glutathione S-transferase